jgi:hypothetical protein
LKVKGQNLSAVGGAVQLLDKDGKEVQPPPARGPQPRPQASAGVLIVPVAQGGGGFGGGGFGGGGFGGGFKDDGTTATMVLEFPKVEGLTSNDGDIEITTVVGGYRIKRDFKLKDMMFKGALAF